MKNEGETRRGGTVGIAVKPNICRGEIPIHSASRILNVKWPVSSVDLWFFTRFFSTPC